MGKKSEKKVRSDRINILRKQYDSFLEEDKKRKERNEYILQRLDKMRYTTSTGLQLRPKVFAEYNQPSYNRFDYRPENVRIHDVIPVPHVHQQINQPNLQLDIPRQFDDISILREISKKYILIPKSRTFIPDNYVVEAMPPPHDNKPVFSEPKSNTVDNGDWRSKYDILEQLKNKEKEEENKQSNKKEAMAKNEQSYKDDKNNIKNYEMQNNNKYEDLPNKYETELPEKDLPSNNFIVENELATVDNLKISDNPAQPETKNVQFQKPIEINSNTYELAEQITNIESDTMEHNVPVAEKVPYISQQEQNMVYDEQEAPENTAYSEGNEQLTEYQNYPPEYEQQHSVADPLQEITPQTQENDIYVNQNDYSPIQTINSSELVQEIHNESEVKDDKDTTEIEYPIDVINVAEFTPQDHVQLQDGININPEYVPIQETYDTSNVGEYVPSQETYEQGNVEGYENSHQEINEQHNMVPTAEHVDNSGIEAFDTEQKEMFYSEQQGEYAYDQQAGGDAYDPEYVPNEQYQGNSDYNYYKELDQQEAYPVEINEHDETNQRYDPSYEQQYAPTQQQDYVVPQEYEQNQQQYEQNPQQYEQNPQQYEQNPQQFEQNPQQYEQNPQQIEQNPQQLEQNQQQLEQNQQEYEEPALYEQIQQGYEQFAYGQQNEDTVQHVEQVLDKEQGYVEEKKTPAVQKKVAKGVAKQKT